MSVGSTKVQRMSNTTYEAVHRQLEEASQRDPRTHRYGFYSTGLAPAPIGLHFWFAEARDMTRGIVMAAMIDDEPDHATLQEALVAADRAVSSVSDNCTEALQHLDRQLCWAGTFDDLSQGKSDYARELRDSFRVDSGEYDESAVEDLDSEPFTAPIEEEEMEAWIEYLQAYGH
jgi:uncharacterized protein with PIN domain